MSKLKRLATINDNVALVHSPITSEEVSARLMDYDLLTPKKFATRYKELLFTPGKFTFDGEDHFLQLNFCTDPFCKWFGMPQSRFSAKGKPSRYRLSGGASKTIVCNPDPVNPTIGSTLDCHVRALSNWSIAEEISRLSRNESVKDIEPEYTFHKPDCVSMNHTPFDNADSFYKQGKSTSNSQRYQCKKCKKKTNVRPSRRESTSYHQKRNDVLPTFARLLLNRTPVSRTCEILEIGRSTYYQKLEWLYRRCLEFLERHEQTPLKSKKFSQMWLNSDKMTYILNNVRKKGQGGSKYEHLEDTQLPTNIVVTAESFSRYVFRADVAYDWDITIEDLALDTMFYKDDHLNEFAKKHARLRFSHYPYPPSKNDTQTEFEYRMEKQKIDARTDYIDGLHVNSTYTSIAHYWLIKHLVKASEWRMITDDDDSLLTAYFRVFAEEIKLGNAHHFLSKVDKTKSRKDAFEEFKQAKEDLLRWGNVTDKNTSSLWDLAYLYLTDKMSHHSFHKIESKDGREYRRWADNPIEHPLASIDKGFHWVDCTTDLSSYDPHQIAGMMLNVTDNASNAFIQQIRRRLSILERPLVTARGDGKSYIYSNFNPKYAQYSLTILRVFYNFCSTFKSGDGKELTPAQRLGITEKKFELKDIIYLQ